MKIVGIYSFNNGKEAVDSQYSQLFNEIKRIIMSVDASKYKTKRSKEKTMRGTILYSPKRLNKAFKKEFKKYNWEAKRVQCEYPTEYYVDGYNPSKLHAGAFREMDFLKERLGVEVQFGKYAFMVYNVAAKMTIFHNLGYIDVGIEIVPVKNFANEMSSGVSYFEQFLWDLQKRGISNIDIPVLILGIDK
ncbi:MAG: restriction endonuclease [Deltaproteobacteria bacterium]|nr:restriction endonuclease [Deltaproteobacteria bacterium]MCL5792960.1 restriction endonuclease [Deltaproteobacteria bacterium]